MPRRRATASLFARALLIVGALAGACGGTLGSGWAPDGGGGTRGAAAGAGGNVALDPSGGGGTVGAGGESGAGDAWGAGGAAGEAHFGEPACPPAVASGGVCTPQDEQLCYKPCGPEGVGVKSEICQSSGLYTEMVGCAYDLSRDYSCYRIPSEPNVVCPGQLPQAGRPCELPPCMPCNSLGGVVGGEYAGGNGGLSEGWCVCQAAPNAAGARTWSCANASHWPCPIGRGC